jgi:EpsI family protein
MFAAVAVARTDRSEQTPLATPLTEFPMQIGEWHGSPLPPFSKDVLDVLRLTDYVTRAYGTPDGASVGLYIGYWQSQRQGDTIHSPLNCLPGSGWESVSQTVLRFADPRDRRAPDLAINRYLIQKGLDRQLVLYWYQSHGRIVASEYWSRFYLMTDAARLNRTDGAIVRVIAPLKDETEDAETRAEQNGLRFVKGLLPHLNQFLPR